MGCYLNAEPWPNGRGWTVGGFDVVDRDGYFEAFISHMGEPLRSAKVNSLTEGPEDGERKSGWDRRDEARGAIRLVRAAYQGEKVEEKG